MLHWHNAFQNLYYLPIVFAGLSFGWLGGLAAALLAALANAPHNWAAWTTSPGYAIDQLWEIPIFCAAGVLTGVLSERGRRQRAELQLTTNRLTEVYRKLQDNFESMKRAERLSALGQLSAGLAHEIRNPLASIAGAAGILQRNPRLETKDGECVEIIARECRRLNDLLSHFLGFARPRSPKYQAADAASLFDSVIELALHAAGGRQPIAFRKQVDPALPPFECDPELIGQVLLNLLINAIQAMPEGGAVLLSARPRNGTCPDRGEGRGLRYRRRGSRPHLRSILHHQGEWDRARALRGASDRGTARRHPQRATQSGQGHYFFGSLAGSSQGAE